MIDIQADAGTIPDSLDSTEYECGVKVGEREGEVDEEA